VALYLKLPDRLASRKRIAIHLLPNCGRAAVPVLVGLLSDKEAEKRARALVSLWRLGSEASGAAPEIARLLGDPESVVSMEASAALQNIGPAAVPVLLRMDEHNSRAALEARSFVICRIGSKAIPELARALEDESPLVRRNAVRCLDDIGCDYEAQVPALARLLRDEDERARFYAASALGHLGEAASPAIPALVGAMVWEEGDGSAFCGPIAALQKIGAPAVPTLVQTMGDRAAPVRKRAAWALERIGPAAKDAIPSLKKALDDRDADVRAAAASALKKICGEEAGK
jgi:HEAT repeat protein